MLRFASLAAITSALSLVWQPAEKLRVKEQLPAVPWVQPVELP
jgi:hypothetical protein